jgi:hypothetical protein
MRSCGWSSSSSRLAGREAEPEADKAFEELAEAIASGGPTPSKRRCRICGGCLICAAMRSSSAGPALVLQECHRYASAAREWRFGGFWGGVPPTPQLS